MLDDTNIKRIKNLQLGTKRLLLVLIVLFSYSNHVSSDPFPIQDYAGMSDPVSLKNSNNLRSIGSDVPRSLQQAQRDAMEDIFSGLNLPIPDGRECLWEYVDCSLNIVTGIQIPPLANTDQTTGTLSTNIGKLTSLMILAINNNLVGSIPTEIGNLLDLRRLYLNGFYQRFGEDIVSSELIDTNRLTGTIPTEFGNLQVLGDAYLANNSLTGTIPPGELGVLIRLNLDHNLLTGPIPSEWKETGWISTLSLNGNEISGTIPIGLTSLLGLNYLGLGNNRLTGTIHTELSELLLLQHLYLNNNELTGTIPTELGGMSLVWLLDFSGNQLTGTIPMELGDIFGPITYLDVSNNDLSGDFTHVCHIATYHVDGNEDLTGNCNIPYSFIRKFWATYFNFFDIEAAIVRIKNGLAIVLEDPTAIISFIEGYIENTIMNEDLND